MENINTNNPETPKLNTWLDLPILSILKLNIETCLFLAIMIVAIFSRFYLLEERVMSHDETSHVYFSWLLEQGQGYKHDPVTHGPLQFHLVALSYFMFGDNDFTARIPAVVFSIATIGFIWNYRRFLGRAGALIGAILLTISPYILYYGRYVRNEAFVGLFGVITLWAILMYLEVGDKKYLLWLTGATVLHFTAKETAFIYTAQALIFIALYLISQILRKEWGYSVYRTLFFVLIIIALFLGSFGGVLLLSDNAPQTAETETVEPAVPTNTSTGNQNMAVGLLAGAATAALASIYFAIKGYSWEKLLQERSFDLLVLLTTLVLPMAAPFPVKFLGRNPIDYSSNQNVIFVGLFIVGLFLISAAIGLVWNAKMWLINAGFFYSVFILLYTTVFTNSFGIITGLVGSLGYWLEQQGVNRGSQPWYFYWLIQIPIYEFLPALGSILAGWIGIRVFTSKKKVFDSTSDQRTSLQDLPVSPNLNTFLLLSYWSITSLIAFTIAGEKMPWLTFHITLPMILLSAWGLGFIFDSIDWRKILNHNGVLVGLILPVSMVSLISTLGFLLGSNPPFQGKELLQLESTSGFLISLLSLSLSIFVLIKIIHSWSFQHFINFTILIVFAFFGILTARAAFMASYVNYDDASEYLVYAHSARGPKDALEQIEEISRKTSGYLSLNVAYDNDTTYPYWWYLRNYPNQNYYGENPTRDLRNAPVILVGDNNFGKIEPIVGNAYQQFDYIRLWWPNQDYFGLTKERVLEAIRNPEMRNAIFQIWLNRNFSPYGIVTNKDMSLTNWYPSSRMRLYIRKDIISTLWNYGSTVTSEVEISDPYKTQIQVTADQVIGSEGVEVGQFQNPKDIAIAPDGTLYVADSDNHRIQHLDPGGNGLHSWGSFGDVASGELEAGKFNQPWGIAVAQDGSVFVADTWNHRIQKFSPSGEFITMWGKFGQAETPYDFWGPRDVAVDSNGRVYITDTGNKRIVVFDENGEFITQFGEVGFDPGQFDEPVGLGIGPDGQLYVADTWNQRMQVFSADENNNFLPLKQWDIEGWYGQSLDNKPYFDLDPDGKIYIADPEGYRILVFSNMGEFIGYIGDFSTDVDGFNLPASVASDNKGGIWVTDSGNNRLMHFTLP